MNEFIKMRDRLIEHFNEMSADADHLYEIEVDKDLLWDVYLNNFPEGTNPIFRERTVHDCSCCRHFIKNIGNVVFIKDNQVHTIWEFDTESTTYQPVVNAIDTFVKSYPVTNMFASQDKRVGVKANHERMADDKIIEWDHFYLDFPDKFLSKRYLESGYTKSNYRDSKNVFQRSLEEITEESILTLLELIAQNSLYRGEEWKYALETLIQNKREYTQLSTDNEKNNFCWVTSMKVGPAISRIRNHSIGVLLTDLSSGMDLDSAVKRYENIVAGPNYKRPKPIYTQKMLNDIIKIIKEKGYVGSLRRRYAVIDDITVNNILFSNKDSAKRMSGGLDIFESMKEDIAVSPKKFSRVEEVAVNEFIEKILPTASEVSVLLENRHAANMVSLIAPVISGTKSMFKWNNSFSWAYSGNITDSDIKERVKSAGGKVDGDLRFSIQWNDIDYDQNDLDAHCIEPSGEEIYYSHKHSRTFGMLDVDIIDPQKGTPAVENITWVNRTNMEPGIYKFFVHQFNNRGGRNGFRAEIEFDGQIYSFNYQKELRQGAKAMVAEVTLDADGTFTIKEQLPSETSSKEIWNVKTNQFVPVSVVMQSPNYWDSEDGIGHRHIFFMLKNCVNPESPNGFYNEFLKEELLEHKRGLEALGAKCRVKHSNDQLSGVGFSTTKRNDILVKVVGTTERVIKVKF